MSTPSSPSIRSGGQFLADRLVRARQAIGSRYEYRIRATVKQDFQVFYVGVSDQLSRYPQYSARAYEFDVGFKIWGNADKKRMAQNKPGLDLFNRMPVPEATEALRIAIAYLLDATSHHSEGEHNEAWAALLRCHFWIGSAAGPETWLEQSAKGGKIQPEAYEQLLPQLLEWLAAYEDNFFPTRLKAIEVILPRVVSFMADKRVVPQRSVDRVPEDAFRELLNSWVLKRGEVYDAFARVISRKSKRAMGRK